MYYGLDFFRSACVLMTGRYSTVSLVLTGVGEGKNGKSERTWLVVNEVGSLALPSGVGWC